MSVLLKASALAPSVVWHGLSNIHVSVYQNQAVKASPPVVFKALYQTKYATKVYRFLMHRFGNFEWLLSQAQFEDRCYVDFWNHSKGLGDSQHDSKLVNPVTKNVFHRVAVGNGLVCGVRFWLEPSDEDPKLCMLGFRFRIQALEEEVEVIRLRVLEQAIEDKTTMEQIEVEFNSAPVKKLATIKLREIE